MGGSNSGGSHYDLPASYGPSAILLVTMFAFALGIMTAKYVHESRTKVSIHASSNGPNV